MEKKNNLSAKMKRLEEIVGKLNESPEIEDAVKLYEEGVKLSLSIKTYLEEVQTKIRVLTEEGEKSVDPDKLGRKDFGND
ncbi:exodeoxyribonuclease VII small subunit [bacterium]|nr:exodeoxyribonuclease VII small subunit [bacterium]